MNPSDEELEIRREIANNILQQLGGSSFFVMTGAKHLHIMESGLRFKLPEGLAKDGINYVEIILTPMDVYRVAFKRITYPSVTNGYTLATAPIELVRTRDGLCPIEENPHSRRWKRRRVPKLRHA